MKRELVEARDSHALIVWANSITWVGEPPALSLKRTDKWSGYPEERREIADFLVEHEINNLVMVAGDAHMLAMDDGSNTGYQSTGHGPAFPLVHAAALDRKGSTKGSPYTLGPFPGGGQFALMSVTDTSESMQVTFTGRDYLGNQLLGMTFEVGPSGIGNPAQLN